jgi:hypothetical protein
LKRHSRPVEQLWIPLFHGKKQQKPLFPALLRPNSALQVIDSIWVRREFRYATEQPNFGGRTGEINGRTAELQRNLQMIQFPPRGALPIDGEGFTMSCL